MTTATATATPPRSHDQRHEALRLANEIRVAQAAFKREVFALDPDASRRRAIGALMDPPDQLRSMRVYALLTAIRRVGSGKAERVLRVTQTSLAKRLGGLTERQRLAIAAQLAPTPAAPLPGQLAIDTNGGFGTPSERELARTVVAEARDHHATA